jgi:hypothetical protein
MILARPRAAFRSSTSRLAREEAASRASNRLQYSFAFAPADLMIVQHPNSPFELHRFPADDQPEAIDHVEGSG